MENRSPLLTKQCFPTRSGQRTVTGIELLSPFDRLAPRLSVVVIDLKPILMLVISPTVEIRIIVRLRMLQNAEIYESSISF